MTLLIISCGLILGEAYFFPRGPAPRLLSPYVAQDPARPTDIIIEDFEGRPVGEWHGVGIAAAPWGSWAILSHSSESRLQYTFEQGFPTQGTLEFLVRVDSGYYYANGVLHFSRDRALLFTTDIAGGDVSWPGSSWLWVANDGTVTFSLVTAKYQSPPAFSLVAPATRLRFQEWHRVGVSFGNEGQHIMVDGELVASAPRNTQPLGSGGTHQVATDRPTIGESVSGHWPNNTFEGGFDGALLAFRASTRQQDWVWTRDTARPDPETPWPRPWIPQDRQ